jgi:hypothetical protein
LEGSEPVEFYVETVNLAYWGRTKFQKVAHRSKLSRVSQGVVMHLRVLCIYAVSKG